MKSGKKKKSNIFFTILLVIVIAFVAALGYSLLQQDGCSSDLKMKSFAIYQGDSKEGIFNDKGGIIFYETETFHVQHFFGDEKIEASLEAIEIAEDYSFTITRTIQDKNVPLAYSWNNSIVASGEGENLVELFELTVDQETNTVSLAGTLSGVLSQYAANIGGTSTITRIPDADMFALKIKAGGGTMTLGLRVMSNAQAVALSQNHVIFR